MRVLDWSETACALAAALGKPVLYVSLNHEAKDDPEAMYGAAPYLRDVDLQIAVDGQATIVCDSWEECEALYDQTVGDDGPTKTNPYDGPGRVYALTIDATGQMQNENT
jgi:hypothetical protein